MRLTLLGELDLSVGPDLEARLNELQTEGRSVLMDLSKLEFMDSTGLGVMTRAINRSRSDRWAFVIDPDVSPQVRTLFRVTALDQFTGIDRMGSSSV